MVGQHGCCTDTSLYGVKRATRRITRQFCRGRVCRRVRGAERGAVLVYAGYGQVRPRSVTVSPERRPYLHAET